MVVPLISVGLYEKQREERLLAFDRKNPPFAQTAKDGPPTSTSRRGVTLRLAWKPALRRTRRRGAGLKTRRYKSKSKMDA